jgi:UDP-2,3-diacylglucosamine hydrolase
VKNIKAIFLSDIHLSSPTDAKTAKLTHFLQSFDGTHLFLMGDIFDLWIGRQNFFLERWLPVTSELLRLHQRGVEIHYFEGNHDLHLDFYFGQQLGFKVHQNPVHMQIGPWQMRLEHGDQMDPDDRGYRFLRWLLRTPVLRAIARSRFSEKYIVGLGERMSHVSRDYTSNRKIITEAVARDKIRKHAEKVYAEKNYDFLIAGHVHISDEHSVGNGKAINLGSWLDQPKAFVLTSEGGKFLTL